MVYRPGVPGSSGPGTVLNALGAGHSSAMVHYVKYLLILWCMTVPQRGGDKWWHTILEVHMY